VYTIARPTDSRTEAVDALVNGECLLHSHLQPIVQLADGAVLGYEALARIDGGPAGWTPADWITEASRTGDALVVESAMLDAALDRFADLPPATYLSVNLSPQAVVAFGAARLVRRTDLDHERLIVEITEHGGRVACRDLTQAIARLRGRGARIAVDDMGLGFSDIAQVCRVRPDVVKLDRGLIHLVDVAPEAVAIVRGVVDYAVASGASVVAEGIERLDQVALLVNLGIPAAQGFLFGRPSSSVLAA
jgi:EAL domain-containing protein (putative c-di-GMP-specific phosphodiesterase class I)